MKTKVGFTCVVLTVLLCFFSKNLGTCQETDWSSTIIHTPLGSLAGVNHHDPDGNLRLTTKKGIPFAKPPVGPLRLSKPKPKEPWQGVLNATDYGLVCPQPPDYSMDGVVLNQTQSEDCLTLNIFVPAMNVSTEALLPVMVWIHGGGFAYEDASVYDLSTIAVHGHVIVVNLNYRLGVLGFLSTGDDSAQGNYGVWDQRLAIQWVKENIVYFHGDADMITIFGESAGGISVGMHAISPVNDRSLFQRVILQSGTASTFFMNSPQEAATRTRQLGRLLQCETVDDSRELMDCLRNTSVDDLLTAAAKLKLEVVQLSPCYPTLDELEENPYPTDLVDGVPHGGELEFLFGDYMKTNPGSLSAQ
ncbi:putative inactive carboxylesterase 4 [Acanthaster planci]|uniref:Inactive carboxylesterase 4 n=1 Tax=Acanthaster planci TaxID=133434 RepID=A0A8B7XIB4_ACAPL|nr:putative inactive carboxylesterase 4 [Acanthaster planci]